MDRGGIRALPLKLLVPLALLIVAVLATYSNSFDVPFQFDGVNDVLRNRSLHEVSRVGDIWRHNSLRFIPSLSFALNYELSQGQVWSYHWVNLALHLINSIMVLLISGLFLRAKGLPDRVASAFVALLFALHPIQTQAVTYIYQRPTLFAALFVLMAVYAYARCRLDASKKFWVWALIAAALAMFSKQNAAALPLALLAVESTLLADKQSKLRSLIPFIIIAALVPLAVLFLGNRELEHIRLQSSHTWYEYFFTQLRAVFTYLRLLALPTGQNLDHDYPLYRSLLQWQVLLCLTALALVTIAALKERRRWSVYSFGFLFFLAMMSIESSFMPLEDLFVEHRLYLPSFGIFLMVGCALASFSQVLSSRSAPLVLALVRGLAVVGLFLLAMATWRRNEVWRSPITLWADAVDKSPRKIRPHVNLGASYQVEGDCERAVAQYDHALTLDASYAAAYLNRGMCFGQAMRLAEAASDFQRVLALEPKSDKAHLWYGITSMLKGDFAAAKSSLTSAIGLAPGNEVARLNLVVAHLLTDELGLAEEEYGRLKPEGIEDVRDWQLLAATWIEKGDRHRGREAMEYALKACRKGSCPEAQMRSLEASLSGL